MAIKILVIHGPNLNLLGDQELQKKAKSFKVQLRITQSNHEGKIVDLIGQANRRYHGILINPAAYTHTSVAIRDAILSSSLPVVEVHLSNIYRREDFRQKSLTAPVCLGQVTGFGKDSYLLGLRGLLQSLNRGLSKGAQKKIATPELDHGQPSQESI